MATAIKKSLLQYVLEKYPNTTYTNFLKFCEPYNINNWRDFAEMYAKFVSIECENITVYDSSSWGVCQEFLGNLTGRDLWYTESRSGFWSMPDTSTLQIVTVREILSDLWENYP